jgi:hypothetical protein
MAIPPAPAKKMVETAQAKKRRRSDSTAQQKLLRSPHRQGVAQAIFPGAQSAAALSGQGSESGKRKSRKRFVSAKSKESKSGRTHGNIG